MKQVLYGMICSLAVCVGVVSATQAQSPSPKATNDQPYASQYVKGKDVSITDPVYGDLYCGGASVTIDTTVHGDVLCAGSDVTIKGTVDGDVRVAGAKVQLEGTVTGSMTVAAAELRTTSDFKLHHDATLFASAAHLSGTFGNNVAIAGGALIFKHASITRDLSTQAGDIKLTDATHVGGWVRHTGDKSPQLTDGSKAGNVVVTAPERPSMQQTLRTWAFIMLALTVFALLVILFMPRAVETLRTRRTRLLMTVFIGVSWTAFAPIVGILLLISAFTWPVGLFILLVWALLILAALPIVAVDLGHVITRRAKTTNIVRGLIGMAMITVLSVLPIINALLVVAICFYGSGRILVPMYRAAGGPGTQDNASTPKRSA